MWLGFSCLFIANSAYLHLRTCWNLDRSYCCLLSMSLSASVSWGRCASGGPPAALISPFLALFLRWAFCIWGLSSGSSPWAGPQPRAHCGGPLWRPWSRQCPCWPRWSHFSSPVLVALLQEFSVIFVDGSAWAQRWHLPWPRTRFLSGPSSSRSARELFAGRPCA